MKYPRGTPLASTPTPQKRILLVARSMRVVNHAAFSLSIAEYFQAEFLRIPTTAAFSAKEYLTKPLGPFRDKGDSCFLNTALVIQQPIEIATDKKKNKNNL